jgi:hypothetical protein
MRLVLLSEAQCFCLWLRIWIFHERLCFNFGREGPGVNDALNWALCAKGVAPKGAAYLIQVRACNRKVKNLPSRTLY